MDPDANLREQREIAAEIIRQEDDPTPRDVIALGRVADNAARLAELVQALDAWITGRGFLPQPWKAAQQAAYRIEPSEPRRVSDAARRTARKVQP